MAFVVAGVACGKGDSNAPSPKETTPVTVREIQIVSGDGQAALRGEDLRLPLQVRVIGSDGQPMSGVNVQWATAIAAAALVDPASSSTDVAGTSVTNVRDLAALGTIEVRATAGSAAAGTAPVASFHVDARDPCMIMNIPSTRIDSVVNGLLRIHDCGLNGFLWDFDGFAVPSQRAVTMSARSSAFDPWITVFTSDWLGRATYAAPPGSGDATMRVILPAGSNGVGVTSGPSLATGPYTLAVTQADEEVTDCALVVVIRGISTDQHLTATDCVGDSHRFDTFIFNLRMGEAIRIVESSTAFVPRLQLLDTLGAVVAESHGDASGSATIDFTLPGRAYYVIAAGSVDAGATGDYRLAISDPLSSGSGTKSAARAPASGRDSARP